MRFRTPTLTICFALLLAVALVPAHAQVVPNTNYTFPSFTPTLSVDIGNTVTGAQPVTLAVGYTQAPGGVIINPVVAAASVTVGAGANAETVTISSVNCSTPTIYDSCQFTATFSNTHGKGDPVTFQPVATPTKLTGSCSGTATSSATLGLFGLGQSAALTCTSTVVTLGQVVRFSGTIRALNVSATHVGVSASSGVFTVLKNGSATASTCTVGTGLSCNDVTHQIAVNPGDVLSVQFTTQASEVLAGASASVLVY